MMTAVTPHRPLLEHWHRRRRDETHYCAHGGVGFFISEFTFEGLHTIMLCLGMLMTRSVIPAWS